MLTTVSLIAFLILSLPPTQAATQIDLKSSASFILLAQNGLSNSGSSIMQGDIGSYPNASQTGFSSVSLVGTNQFGNSVTQSALADATSAKNVALGLTPTATIANTLTAQTFGPGISTTVQGNLSIN